MSVRRVLGVLALAGGLVLLVAAPASAHAQLVQTDPAPGAVLAKSPQQITLNFSEVVSVEKGAVRVFNSKAERVDNGGVEESGRTVRLPVPTLAKGSYVVTWRVTSADSHPVNGAFTFQVGTNVGAGATSREVTGLAGRLLNEQGGDKVIGVALGVVRWVVFAGMALLIGGAAFAAAVFPDVRRSKRARRIVWSGWIAVTAATLLGLLLYGPYAEGLGFGDMFSSTLIGDTLALRFGQIWLARLAVLLVVAPLLVLLFRRDDDGASRPLPRWWVPIAAPIAVLIAATPGLAGHAVTGGWKTAAVGSDTLHVLAMAVWLGGLVMLAAVAMRGRDAVRLSDALPRFSKLALGCVVAIVVTGAFQTWRQVGSLDALRSTDYGRILVVKLVLFAGVIVFAALSREIVFRLFWHEEPAPAGVPAVAGGSDDGALAPGAARAHDPDLDREEFDEELELRHLRRSLWAEVGLAMAVLAATALLVNAAPAREASAGATGGAVGVTLDSKKVSVDISAAPGVKGTNDLHVNTLTPDGAPKDVQDLSVTVDLPGKKIAPIAVPLRRLSPGHYYSPGFDIPIAGDWRVVAKPLLSQFDQPVLRGTVTIG